MANETAEFKNVVGGNGSLCGTTENRSLVAVIVAGLACIAVAVALWRDAAGVIISMPMGERVEFVRDQHAVMSAADLGIQEPITDLDVGLVCGSVPQLTFTDSEGKQFSVSYCDLYDDDGWYSLPPKEEIEMWRLSFRHNRDGGPNTHLHPHSWNTDPARKFHGLLIRWAENSENKRRFERLLNAEDRPDYEREIVADLERQLLEPEIETTDKYFELKQQWIHTSAFRRNLPNRDQGFLKAYGFLRKLDWFYCSEEARMYRGNTDDFSN